jgi:hypothetical protein
MINPRPFDANASKKTNYTQWRAALEYWAGITVAALSAVFIVFWTIAFAQRFLGLDATTYLAAGERLNAAHSLYGPLQLGDRPVLIAPPYWTTPLVSPPLIAVLWRPFASVNGLVVWMLADGAAVLAVVLYAVHRRAPLLVLLASIAVGLQLATGNVSGFILLGVLILWTHRSHPWVGHSLQ